MMESMGEVAPFIDPDMILAMNWVFFITSCIVGLTVLFPAFISLKAEGKVSWAWTVVFVPAFILDALIMVVLLSRPASTMVDDPKDDGSEATQTENEEPAQTEKKKQNSGRMQKAFSILYFALFIAFQALLALKLDDNLERSWWIVFAPWLIMEFFHFLDITHSVRRDILNGFPHFKVNAQGFQEVEMRPLSLAEKTSLLLDSHGQWALRVIQVILIASKLQGTLAISWTLVFLPTWLWGAMRITSLVLLARGQHTDPAKKMMVHSSIGLFVVSALFVYVTAGLLVSRLNSEDGKPSATMILIPVFIITGSLFCCVACCLPLMFKAVRRNLESQLKNGPETEGDVTGPSVSVERRIENGQA